MYKVWVIVDENGVITSAYGGQEDKIVETDDSYDFYFEVTEDIFRNMGKYKVENGELIERA